MAWMAARYLSRVPAACAWRPNSRVSAALKPDRSRGAAAALSARRRCDCDRCCRCAGCCRCGDAAISSSPRCVLSDSASASRRALAKTARSRGLQCLRQQLADPCADAFGITCRRDLRQGLQRLGDGRADLIFVARGVRLPMQRSGEGVRCNCRISSRYRRALVAARRRRRCSSSSVGPASGRGIPAWSTSGSAAVAAVLRA